MKKVLSLIFTPFALLLLGLPVVCSSLKETSFQIVSASSQERNVLDELLAVPEFKTKYDLGFYNANPSLDEFDVLYAVENGYTGNKSYSLYLYVWNKSGKGTDYYVFDDQYNSVSIYDVTKASNNNYEIQFVNKSSDNLFIKYRVLVSAPNQFINDDLGSREYAITGIQIGHYYVGTLIRLTDYPVGKKWNFRSDESDTVVTYYDTFKYLELDVYGGAYGFGQYTDFVSPSYFLAGDYSIRRQNNLYYVWFNVPTLEVGMNDLFSIHADYYDFDLSNKVSAVVDEHSLSYYQELYPDTMTGMLDFYDDYQNEGFSQYQNDYIFHLWCDDIYVNNTYPSRIQPNYYGDKLFHVAPYKKTIMQVTNVMWEWDYTASEFLDAYPIILNIDSFSSDLSGKLVADVVDRHTAELVSGQNSSDVYHNIHYCNQVRSDSDAIEVNWDLISVGSTQSSIWNWWHQVTDLTNVQDLNCIEKVNYSDKYLSDSELSSKYYVNENDLPLLRSCLDVDSDTYIFRFKLAYSSSIELDYNDGVTQAASMVPDRRIGYVAPEYEAVIDFDVLDLTFVDGEDELINYPVVASPINVFPDVPSPLVSGGCGNFFDGFLSILLILALILFIILFLKWFIPFMRYKKLERKIVKNSKSKRHRSHRNKKRKKGRKRR